MLKRVAYVIYVIVGFTLLGSFILIGLLKGVVPAFMLLVWLGFWLTSLIIKHDETTAAPAPEPPGPKPQYSWPEPPKPTWPAPVALLVLKIGPEGQIIGIDDE
jgi:hypothetical protein